MENKTVCPHCKMEVDPKASRCPHCQGKIYQWTFTKKFIAGGMIFIAFAIFIASMSGGSTTPTPQPAPSNFISDAHARFENIKSASPELASIDCSGSCSTVVFNYTTVPSDLDTVIRGNAALFAKFKNDKTGSGDVTIIAKKGDATLLTCKATTFDGVGRVTNCQ